VRPSWVGRFGKRCFPKNRRCLEAAARLTSEAGMRCNFKLAKRGVRLKAYLTGATARARPAHTMRHARLKTKPECPLESIDSPRSFPPQIRVYDQASSACRRAVPAPLLGPRRLPAQRLDAITTSIPGGIQSGRMLVRGSADNLQARPVPAQFLARAERDLNRALAGDQGHSLGGKLPREEFAESQDQG
jgi:hypothetical protein